MNIIQSDSGIKSNGSKNRNLSSCIDTFDICRRICLCISKFCRKGKGIRNSIPSWDIFVRMQFVVPFTILITSVTWLASRLFFSRTDDQIPPATASNKSLSAPPCCLRISFPWTAIRSLASCYYISFLLSVRKGCMCRTGSIPPINSITISIEGSPAISSQFVVRIEGSSTFLTAFQGCAPGSLWSLPDIQAAVISCSWFLMTLYTPVPTVPRPRRGRIYDFFAHFLMSPFIFSIFYQNYLICYGRKRFLSSSGIGRSSASLPKSCDQLLYHGFGFQFQFIQTPCHGNQTFHSSVRICWIVSALVASSTEKAPWSDGLSAPHSCHQSILWSLRSIVSAFLVKPSFLIKRRSHDLPGKSIVLQNPFLRTAYDHQFFLVGKQHTDHRCFRYDPRYFFRIFSVSLT